MVVRFILLIIIGACCLSQSAYSQSLNTLKASADLYFSQGKYKDALDNYIKIQKEKPNKVDIKYKLGICYLELGNIQNAEQYLLFVANQKGSEPISWYQLGRLNHKKHQFKKAISYYKTYVKLADKGDKYRLLAKHYIRQCASAREIVYNKELAIVDNLGNIINGPYDDYAPIVSPGRENTIYFSSIREANTGGLRDAEGLGDEILGTYKSDIYSSQMVNGEWTSIRPFSNLINSSRNDQILGFSEDATVLYYYKGYHPTKDGAIFTDTLRTTEAIVFPTEFSSPVKIKKGDTDPFFFNDDIILFASDREGGYGGLDIYVTRRLTGGFWTRPENLGPQVNSPFDEKAPFLTKNGRTLFYSSNNNLSMGGFDIFKSDYLDSSKEWTSPQNVGTPINSAGDELNFSISKDGLKSYFSSDRFDGKGGFDIYAGYFKTVQVAHLNASSPAAFNLVDEGIVSDNNPTTITSRPTGTNTNNVSVAKEKVILNYLFYEGDNIITPSNISELNKIVDITSKYPNTKVEISGHTDDTDPEKFRLYFSYLRAEKAANFLIKNGVRSENVIVKGFGSSYPLAKNKSLDGSESKMGKKLNRRIEFRLLGMENTAIDVVYKKPDVNERIKEFKRSFYDGSLKGLSYKVQVAAMKSMYDSNIIIKYTDAMVEKESERDILRYCVGLFRSYSSAQRMRNDLRKEGVNKAYIAAYIDGVRINQTYAEILSKQYPDLKNYLIGN